ncbi:MAG: DUF3305 domain-containing protein [Burkholderiales bacterium]|nr:DUF3305 domain-containing protein [Burkholderiales bacterium]
MDQPTYPLAVIMERIALENKWCTEKWEVKGVVRDVFGAEAKRRVIYEDAKHTQILFPGYVLVLYKDEVDNYHLNLSAPTPKVFVLWREQEGTPVPHSLTVSYGEAARWMDSNETVDAVALPEELYPWISEFIERHYHPEPKKIRRRT